MDERGLLDLMIIRLPKLSYKEKITLSTNLSGESEFIKKSK